MNEIKPLLNRAKIFLEDKNWEKVDEYCEKALDIDPECGEAYLYKLLAETRNSTLGSIISSQIYSLKEFKNFRKILKYGDEVLINKINTIQDQCVNKMVDKYIKNLQFDEALDFTNSEIEDANMKNATIKKIQEKEIRTLIKKGYYQKAQLKINNSIIDDKIKDELLHEQGTIVKEDDVIMKIETKYSVNYRTIIRGILKSNSVSLGDEIVIDSGNKIIKKPILGMICNGKPLNIAKMNDNVDIMVNVDINEVNIGDYIYNGHNKNNSIVYNRMEENSAQEENKETKKAGCYVATCVYGSYDCPEVWVLRRYRDIALQSAWYGRIFIKVYYIISPIIVSIFGKTKLFKTFFKNILDKMVIELINEGYKDTKYND